MVERIVPTRMEPMRPSRTLMGEEVKGGEGKGGSGWEDIWLVGSVRNFQKHADQIFGCLICLRTPLEIFGSIRGPFRVVLSPEKKNSTRARLVEQWSGQVRRALRVTIDSRGSTATCGRGIPKWR